MEQKVKMFRGSESSRKRSMHHNEQTNDQPVEDLVCEELACPLKRTSNNPFHPLPHLFSNQLLQKENFTFEIA